MAEYTNARFLAGLPLDFSGDRLADPAEPGFAIGLHAAVGHKPLALFALALGHDNEGEFFAVLLALDDLGADAFIAERDFWNQNHVAAHRDAGVRRDPARVPSHHLQHHHAIVALRRRPEPVQGIRGAGDRRIETECHDRGFEIVVNGFGHANQRHAVLEQLLRDGERTIAADTHQRPQTELVKITLCLLENFGGNFPDVAVTGLRGEPALVRRAEDGAAQEKQTVHLVIVEDAITPVEQALIAVEKADGSPATLGGGLDHRANDRVQTGTITAARENANTFAHAAANRNRPSAIGNLQSALFPLNRS